MIRLAAQAALFFWVFSMVVHAVTLVLSLIQPLLRRNASHRADMPPVSVILPVHRYGAMLEEGLVSVFAEDYPAFEVIIAAQDAEDDVIALCERLQRLYPDVKSVIVRGSDRFAASPKVNNIAEAFRQASHDVMVLKDDNMILREGQLASLVSELVPEVGIVVATPLIHEAQGFAGEIERAYINAHSGRWLMTGSTLGQGFGIGKLFAMRLSDFTRAGGLEIIAHTIAEDHAMTKAMAKIGLPTVMAEMPGHQALGPRTLIDVWRRQVRWSVCRRLEEPLANLGEALASPLIAVLAGLIAAPVIGWNRIDVVGFTVVYWVLCDVLFDKAKGILVTPLSVVASVVRDIMMPSVWITAHLTDKVVWGGEKRTLRGHAYEDME